MLAPLGRASRLTFVAGESEVCSRVLFASGQNGAARKSHPPKLARDPPRNHDQSGSTMAQCPGQRSSTPKLGSMSHEVLSERLQPISELVLSDPRQYRRVPIHHRLAQLIPTYLSRSRAGNQLTLTIETN